MRIRHLKYLVLDQERHECLEIMRDARDKKNSWFSHVNLKQHVNYIQNTCNYQIKQIIKWIYYSNATLSVDN